MYEIQANAKGSRHLAVSDGHLETIRKYALFHGLVGSTGIVDELALEKLCMNVRSLIDAHPDNGDLLDFCKEVLYHDNMKPFGLSRLMALYDEWLQTHPQAETGNTEAE